MKNRRIRTAASVASQDMDGECVARPRVSELVRAPVGKQKKNIWKSFEVCSEPTQITLDGAGSALFSAKGKVEDWLASTGRPPPVES